MKHTTPRKLWWLSTGLFLAASLTAHAEDQQSASFTLRGGNLNSGGVVDAASTEPSTQLGSIGGTTGQSPMPERMTGASGAVTATSGFWAVVRATILIVDTDGDGVRDLADNCPDTPNPGQEDADGNGTGDACNTGEDTDGDNWADGLDNCPTTLNSGQEDLDGDLLGDVCDDDRDGDLVPNIFDAFPDDPLEQSDIDTDGVGDNGDNCPGTPNSNQTNTDGDPNGNACDDDDDGDDLDDLVDNCPLVPNLDQFDLDEDLIGDVCDDDIDGDGRANTIDNCPVLANGDQSDVDADTVGDVCDNCPADANPGQEDDSGNGTGNVCNDADGDGLVDAVETNTGQLVDAGNTGTDPLNPDTDGDLLSDGVEVLDYGSDPHNPDTDADTVIDGLDNCVLVANLDQADADEGADDDSSLEFLQHYGDRCDADLNNDGITNTADFFGFFRPCFATLVSNSPSCAQSDFDGSGVINTADFFGFFRPQFGSAPGPGVSGLQPVGESVLGIFDAETWNEADAFCQSWDGNLAIIKSAEKNEAVRVVVSEGNAYIGLHEGGGPCNGQYCWVDDLFGSPTLPYTSWAAGEPVAGKCGYIDAADGTWRIAPVSCGDTDVLPFVCERPIP